MATLARAQTIVILGANSSYDTDELAAQAVLESGGHASVVIGPNIPTYTGGDLSGVSAVVLLDGDQTGNGYNMPIAGQTALLNFVNAGGGLVTAEWSVWSAHAESNSSTLAAAFPVVPTSTYDATPSITYGIGTPNATLDYNLPSSFSFTADNIGGTETQFAPLPGGTAFITSSGSLDWGTADGLIGWNYGSGRVASFSTLVGPTELSDPNYAQLFNNAVNYAAGINPPSAPEPSTWAMMLGSLGALVYLRRRVARV